MTSAADEGAGAPPAASAARTSAGAKLRAAREAQSLSIEAVAQQLKLAPRQVQALENDDYGRLPGRTFVRGFSRNYARFVHLDPDAVLASLPASDASPALERPGLGSARRPMGELPVKRPARASALRWFFPLLLVAIVVVAGYYEYLRDQGILRPFAMRDAGHAAGGSALPNPASEAGPEGKRGDASGPESSARAGDRAQANGPQASGLQSNGSQALPNPLAPPASAPTAGGPAASAPVTNGSAANTGAMPGATAPAAAGEVPRAPPTGAQGASARPAGTAAGPAGPAAAAPGSRGSPAPVSAAAALVLRFTSPSWVEVRDASGRVVLKATEAAGTSRAVDGAPPFELTVGNAPGVSVTFRGRPVDLTPYTRGAVARVKIE